MRYDDKPVKKRYDVSKLKKNWDGEVDPTAVDVPAQDKVLYWAIIALIVCGIVAVGCGCGSRPYC